MSRSATSESLTNELAERLRQRIQAESLADGELFMTEAQLAEEYEVSRTVAREAVSRLRALGILEGRQRKGLVVRRPDPLRLLASSLPSLADSDRDFRELQKLRYVLEVGAIELAVRNATDEQIDELEGIADGMEQAIRADVLGDRAIGLDLSFHALVLRMTGSSLIAGLQQVLVEYFRCAGRRGSTSNGDADRIIWEHRELLAAIRVRDAEHSRAMIRVQFRDLLTGDGS
jgi:DNA-binding FadR family transcriptional regulator